MSKHKNQARRDKARQKKQADKALIQLSKERRELWQMERDAPMVKSDEPFQRGWVRYFALTKEVTQRKDVEHFQKLLKYVQCIQHSRHPQFLVKKHWKSRRLTPSRHNLVSFGVSTLIWLKVPEELLPYLMTEQRRPISTRARLKELSGSYYRGKIKVRHPQYFERVVKPYIVTHRRVALPDVERRLAEIAFILDQGPNEGRLYNLQRSRVPSWKYLSGKQNPVKDYRRDMKEAQHELLEYYMEENSITQEKGVIPTLSFFFIFSQLTIFNN